MWQIGSRREQRMADNKDTETQRAPRKATRAEARRAADAELAKAREAEAARQAELDKPAELAPASDMSPSGAIIEDEAKAVDFAHPAVDNNPRAGTTVRQNAIDFNDP